MNNPEVVNEILQSFNCRFWFIVHDTHWSFNGSDAFEAMGKMLEHAAMFDIELPKRLTINANYLVSVDLLRWAILPVGFGYRQCSPKVQDVIRTAFSYKYGEWFEPYLEQSDLEWMDELERQLRDARVASSP